VLDVMVHIDSEDDAQSKPNAHLPQRHLLLTHLASRLDGGLPPSTRVVLHYLGGKVEAELLVDPSVDIADLQRQCTRIAQDDPYFRHLAVYQAAPN
jgi:hypothetical protein